MVTTYMLQYLDKVTLGFAAVLGVQKDIVSLPRRAEIKYS